MSLKTVDTVFVKAFDVVAKVINVLKLIPGRKELIEKILSTPQFKSVFNSADVDGKSSLSPEELYTFVLSFYMVIAQYTLVIARQVPTRADVLRYHHFIKGKDDGVKFDDFKRVFLLLCDGIAVQLAAQLLFTLVLSPMLALCIVGCIRHAFSLFPFLFSQFFFIPQFLRNDAIGLLLFVPALNFLVVPYYLEYVFYIQSLRSGPGAVRFVPDMKQFQPVPFPFPSSSPSKVSVSSSLSPKESSELTEEVQEKEEVMMEVERCSSGSEKDTEEKKKEKDMLTEEDIDLPEKIKDPISKKDD